MRREDGQGRRVGERVTTGTRMPMCTYCICTLPSMCVVGVHAALCACITEVTIKKVCIIQFMNWQFGMHN